MDTDPAAPENLKRSDGERSGSQAYQVKRQSRQGATLNTAKTKRDATTRPDWGLVPLAAYKAVRVLRNNGFDFIDRPVR